MRLIKKAQSLDDFLGIKTEEEFYQKSLEMFHLFILSVNKGYSFRVTSVAGNLINPLDTSEDFFKTYLKREYMFKMEHVSGFTVYEKVKELDMLYSLASRVILETVGFNAKYTNHHLVDHKGEHVFDIDFKDLESLIKKIA